MRAFFIWTAAWEEEEDEILKLLQNYVKYEILTFSVFFLISAIPYVDSGSENNRDRERKRIIVICVINCMDKLFIIIIIFSFQFLYKAFHS